MRYYLLVLATFLGLAGSASAGFVVAPSSLTSVDGNEDDRSPFFVNGGMRYQQVYGSSQFTGVGNPMFISGMAFRLDGPDGGAFSLNLSSVDIWLSTTTKAVDGLSGTFASNIGVDQTLVRSGALSISSADVAGPGNTRAFDVVISFQTSFLYDPTKGNLLLDIRNNDTTNNFTNNFFDAGRTAGDSVSRVLGAQGNPNAVTGNAGGAQATQGLVTQFQIQAVPVPPTVLMGMISFGVLGFGRFVARRAKQKADSPTA
jgi:hypothetical protein